MIKKRYLRNLKMVFVNVFKIFIASLCLINVCESYPIHQPCILLSNLYALFSLLLNQGATYIYVGCI
jgi:hypothetical protein